MSDLTDALLKDFLPHRAPVSGCGPCEVCGGFASVAYFGKRQAPTGHAWLRVIWYCDRHDPERKDT